MYFVLWLRRTMTSSSSSSAKSSLCVEFYLLCTFVDNCCERGKKGRWMAWEGEIVPSSNPQPSTQRTLSFHPRNAYLTIKQKNEIRKRKIMMQRKRKPNQSKPNEEGKPQTKENRNSSKIKMKNSLPTTLVFRFFVIITMTSNQSSLSRQSSSGKSISF